MDPANTTPPPPITPPATPAFPQEPMTAPVTPQPPTQSQPTGAQSVITGGSPKKGMGKFGIFVALSIIILVAVWAIVGYLYLQNQNLENETPNEVVPEVSPTPAFHPSEIQVINGDVVRMSSVGESETLVSKKDYSGTGITGFARVSVSPDNTMLCFESIPPATGPALYLSKVDGSEVVEVSKNKHMCNWSQDNNFVFYVNDPLGEAAINIYAYSLTSKEERNLTESANTSEIRQYAIESVVENKLMCKYDTVNATGTKLSSGTCEIDLVSGDLTETGSI